MRGWQRVLQRWAPAPRRDLAARDPEVILFDTEFTQFRDGELLSIGLVVAPAKGMGSPVEPASSASIDPRWAFYAEVDDAALHARASAFCQQGVLPQRGRIPGAACRSLQELGTRLGAWLAARDRRLILGYDYKLDWRFLEAALVAAGQWDALRSRLMGVDVAEALADPACRHAAQGAQAELASPAPGALQAHHALADARVLAAAWAHLPEAAQVRWTQPFRPSLDGEATRLARR